MDGCGVGFGWTGCRGGCTFEEGGVNLGFEVVFVEFDKGVRGVEAGDGTDRADDVVGETVFNSPVVNEFGSGKDVWRWCHLVGGTGGLRRSSTSLA